MNYKYDVLVSLYFKYFCFNLWKIQYIKLIFINIYGILTITSTNYLILTSVVVYQMIRKILFLLFMQCHSFRILKPILLREKEGKRETESRERGQGGCYSQVGSSYACQNQRLAWSKAGRWQCDNPMSVSHMGGKDPVIWATSDSLPGSALPGSWSQEPEPRTESKHTDMECLCLSHRV